MRPSDLTAEFRDAALHVAWRAGLVPAGWAAELVLQDGKGQPLPGLKVAYSAATAVVTGDALHEGTTLHVTLALRPPASLAVDVIVHLLPVPAKPALDNRGGGILVSWQPVAGATDYRFTLLDSDDVPVAPMPAVTRPDAPGGLTAWIDGAALIDGRTYGVRVVASADGSVGGWSETASLVLDKRAPDSALLRALKARLVAAGTAPTLDATLIGDPAVADLLIRLLSTPEHPLKLAGVTPASDNHVTARGTTTIFGRATEATAIFRDSGQLSLTLTASLGAMTLVELDAAQLLPGSAWPSTSGPPVSPASTAST